MAARYICYAYMAYVVARTALRQRTTDIRAGDDPSVTRGREFVDTRIPTAPDGAVREVREVRETRGWLQRNIFIYFQVTNIGARSTSLDGQPVLDDGLVTSSLSAWLVYCSTSFFPHSHCHSFITKHDAVDLNGLSLPPQQTNWPFPFHQRPRRHLPQSTINRQQPHPNHTRSNTHRR